MARPSQPPIERFAEMGVGSHHQELNNIILTDGAPRPDQGGRSGKKISVLTNMFQLKYPKDQTLYMFDVDVTPIVTEDPGGGARKQAKDTRPLPPDVTSEAFKRAVAQMSDLSALQQAGFAFDGRKIAFTTHKLPFTEREDHVELPQRSTSTSSTSRPPRPRMFSVKMQYARLAEFNVLDLFIKADRQQVMASGSAFIDNLFVALQGANIAFRNDCIGSRLKQHGAGGRRFFDPSTAQGIAAGAEIWRGFFQSVLPLQSGLFLNLDVCFSPFVASGPFLEVAARILNRASGGDRGGSRGRGGRGRGSSYPAQGSSRIQPITMLSNHEKQQLRKTLRGVAIRVTHRAASKPEKFSSFTDQSAKATQFERDGRVISIAQYFLEQHNIRLRFPDLPCAIIGSGRTSVPLELCEVIGGHPIAPQKMTTTQVQDMISVSAQRPSDRIGETEQWRTKRNYGRNGLLKEWKIEVAPKMAALPARVLPPPTVEYQRGPMRGGVRNGSWNLVGNQFKSPGRALRLPVIVNFTRASESDCQHFIAKQIDCLKALGMRVQLILPRITYVNANDDPAAVVSTLFEAGKRARSESKAKNVDCMPQVFFCMLDEGNSVYESIKSASTNAIPLATPTQCYIVRKAFKEQRQEQYLANVAMKINIKLGGTNHTVSGANLPRMSDQTMLIGMDVRHPAPGSSQPSIAAAVASMNSKGQFSSDICLQVNPHDKAAQEVVLYGSQIFENLLRTWKRSNGGKMPAHIFFVRDGVSQGEYNQVAKREIQGLFETCAQKEFGEGYRPKVTFIISTKKHRTRFFASSEKDADKSGNLPAGTVVDTNVVHPYAFDFYLQAHGGLVGTTRPAHYVVLRDDMKFSSDDIQQVCYSMCHGYARATRSVSQAPIVKYAHFLAEKAAMTLFSTVHDSQSTISSHSGGAQYSDYAAYEGTYRAMRNKLENRNAQTGVLNTPGRDNVVLSETLWFM